MTKKIRKEKQIKENTRKLSLPLRTNVKYKYIKSVIMKSIATENRNIFFQIGTNISAFHANISVILSIPDIISPPAGVWNPRDNTNERDCGTS